MNRWLIVPRGTFETALARERAATNELIAAQRELIERLKHENESVTALFNMKSNFEVIDTQVDKVTLKLKPQASNVAAGRAGFRGARVAQESRTQPPVGDSVQDLERRVAREGGKV